MEQNGALVPTDRTPQHQVVHFGYDYEDNDTPNVGALVNYLGEYVADLERRTILTYFCGLENSSQIELLKQSHAQTIDQLFQAARVKFDARDEDFKQVYACQASIEEKADQRIQALSRDVQGKLFELFRQNVNNSHAAADIEARIAALTSEVTAIKNHLPSRPVTTVIDSAERRIRNQSERFVEERTHAMAMQQADENHKLSTTMKTSANAVAEVANQIDDVKQFFSNYPS